MDCVLLSCVLIASMTTSIRGFWKMLVELKNQSKFEETEGIVVKSMDFREKQNFFLESWLCTCQS